MFRLQYAHQDDIYMIKNTVKANIVKYLQYLH